jgi:hypothetical protein
MRNSLKMDVLDELRLFREKRQNNSTFYTRLTIDPVSDSNLNMNLNLNLKLESETVERIVTSSQKSKILTVHNSGERLGRVNAECQE